MAWLSCVVIGGAESDEVIVGLPSRGLLGSKCNNQAMTLTTLFLDPLPREPLYLGRKGVAEFFPESTTPSSDGRGSESSEGNSRVVTTFCSI